MVKLDDFIKEFRVFAKAMNRRLDGIDKRLGTHDKHFDEQGGKLDRHDRQIRSLSQEFRLMRLESKQNWQEQREFNREIMKRFDVLDDSVKALGKRVRYQEDTPERLEKVENDTYELKRRVGAVERKVV